MRRAWPIAVASLLLVAAGGTRGSQQDEEGGMRVRFEDGGVVANENREELPLDCPELSGEREIVVHAGRRHAREFPGVAFTYDAREWRVEPCTRLTVTFVNDDRVRHQWMIHGLPKYLYPMGMFTLSVTGPGRVTGTFVVPGEPATYLVHCDVPMHTEKGMKGQLHVGPGRGDLPGIPGITASRIPDPYDVVWGWWSTLVLAAAVLVGTVLGALATRRSR